METTGAKIKKINSRIITIEVKLTVLLRIDLFFPARIKYSINVISKMNDTKLSIRDKFVSDSVSVNFSNNEIMNV